MVSKQDNKGSFRGLGTTKALRKICFDLMDKGVSKNKISDYCEGAGYLGLPGSIGHRYGQVVKGGLVLGFGALGSYLGNKIDNPSLMPEILGGLIGLCSGLSGSFVAEAEEINKPLIQSLIDNHPKELREVYLENGFSKNEINEIFAIDRCKEKFNILFGR